MKLPYTLHMFGLAILCLLFQEVILAPLFPDFLAHPHLLVVLLLVVGFTQTNLLGAVISFCLGTLLDFSNGILLGPWAGSFVFCFLVLVHLSQRIYLDNIFIFFILSILTDFFSAVFYYLMLYFVPNTEELSLALNIPWLSIVSQSFVTGIYSILLSKLFFPSFGRNIGAVKGSKAKLANEGIGLW